MRWGPSPYLHSCRLSRRNPQNMGSRAEIRTRAWAQWLSWMVLKHNIQYNHWQCISHFFHMYYRTEQTNYVIIDSKLRLSDRCSVIYSYTSSTQCIYTTWIAWLYNTYNRLFMMGIQKKFSFRRSEPVGRVLRISACSTCNGHFLIFCKREVKNNF